MNEHLIEKLCLTHHFALMSGHQHSGWASTLTTRNLLLIPVDLIKKLPDDIPLHDILSKQAVIDCDELDDGADDYLSDDAEDDETFGTNYADYGIDVEDTQTLERVVKVLEPHGPN